MRRQIVAATITATAAMAAGCGGPSQTTMAQNEWENREGTTWTQFEAAYSSGWMEGCNQAKDALYDEEFKDLPASALSIIGGDCSLPANAEDSVSVPDTPPVEPRATGYRLGLKEGCADVFVELHRDDEAPRRCRPQLRVSG